jgi:adenylate cyclase
VPQNVEIKARVPDIEALRQRAAEISGGEPEVVVQEDVFFNTPNGRLKLRFFTPERGELIYYERADQDGPKTSTYSIVETDQPGALRDALSNAYGIRNTVRKTRQLYMSGRTRIHVDDVEALGHFMELEVVLQDGENQCVGESEARGLMERLGIASSQLIESAYVDLLEEQSS